MHEDNNKLGFRYIEAENRLKQFTKDNNTTQL